MKANTWIIAIVAVVVVGALVLIFTGMNKNQAIPTTDYSNSYTANTTPSSTTTPPGNNITTPQPVSITIQNFAFSPATITVPVGTTVTWTNVDSAPHTATADNGTFDTGRLQQGQSGSYTFAKAGTYTYYCAVHPMMKATIVVQ